MTTLTGQHINLHRAGRYDMLSLRANGDTSTFVVADVTALGNSRCGPTYITKVLIGGSLFNNDQISVTSHDSELVAVSAHKGSFNTSSKVGSTFIDISSNGTEFRNSGVRGSISLGTSPGSIRSYLDLSISFVDRSLFNVSGLLENDVQIAQLLEC